MTPSRDHIPLSGGMVKQLVYRVSYLSMFGIFKCILKNFVRLAFSVRLSGTLARAE